MKIGLVKTCDLLSSKQSQLNYRYLTSIPIRKQSILIAYIVKSIKKQRANSWKRICLYWKTISQII